MSEIAHFCSLRALRLWSPTVRANAHYRVLYMFYNTMKSIGIYTVSRSVQLGLVGGVVGAIVMGGLAYMMPVNGEPFFIAAAMLMGIGSMATIAGWMLHLITGLVAGAVFGFATAKVTRFHLSGVSKGIGLGISAGILVWVVFFLPMMIAVMASMIPSGQMPLMIAGSFAAHLVYGLVLGGLTGALLIRQSPQYKCEACGESFHSQEELKHSKVHMQAAKQYKCPSCGASFASQAELIQHSKMHPMTRTA